MPFTTLSTGIDMHYEATGTGDPLLLIMGPPPIIPCGILR